MIIKGYLPTSVIEWPGKVSAIIFTGGCNFRCPFCHNPELIKGEGRRVKSRNNILKDLEKRKKWLDAVVITGGEPTLQTDLGDFLGKVKALGLKVMIETNGSKPDVIARLLNPPAGRAGCQIVDRIAIDIKGPLNQQLEDIIGIKKSKIKNKNDKSKLKTFEKVQKSLEIILQAGIDFELRTTVVSGIHNKEIIEEMAVQIENLKLKIENFEWYLQTFSPKKCLDPEFEKIKPYTQKEMEKMLQTARKILPNTNLR